jgi:hypothetical protein
MTTPTGLEPTQTRRPWRATLRTALAVGIPAILLLPTVIQIIVDELGPSLPDRYTGWLLAAGIIITGIASAITRILALPGVELLLRRLPGAAFAAQPQPKPDDHDDLGATDIGTAALVIIAAIAVIVFVVWLLGGPVGGPR